MNRRRYYAAICLGAALWGMIAIFVKQLTAAGLDSLEIVAVRAITSAVCLAALTVCWRRRSFAIRLGDCWYFAGTGIISLVFFNYCYFKAIELTGVALAATLLYTAPTLVMLISAVLFKERFTWYKALAAALTFGGCALMAGAVSSETAASPEGVLLGLGSGLGYALYSVFSRYALRRYDSLTISLYTFIFAAAAMAGMVDWSRAAGIAGAAFGEISAAALGIALVCTIIPYLLYTYGLTGIETGRAAVFATVEPVVAVFIGWRIYNEELSAAKAVGILLVVIAVGLSSLNRGAEE